MSVSAALVHTFLPVQDPHGRLPVLDEAHAAIVAPLVLDGDTADLNHHIPQLLGCTATLFRAWQLFARGSQELAELLEDNWSLSFFI